MAKKGKGKVFGDIPEALQILAQAGLDEAAEVVQRLEERFAPLKLETAEQAAIAKAIYEALDSAFTRAAKS